jgi:heat shock protein HslJ
MTRKACPPAQQADDDWLSSFLTSEPALRVEGSTLTLGDDSSGMTLEERKDVALVGTRWVVDGLVSNDAVSSLPAGVTADLTIDPNGTISGSGGCNRFSGGVTVEDGGDGTGTLFVGEGASTLMACPPDVAAVEMQVLSVLRGRVDYVIDGRQLTLTTDRRG